jgi:flagellar biogenesis protein FliO
LNLFEMDWREKVRKMKQAKKTDAALNSTGLGAWLLGRWRSGGGGRTRPRLELLERIALAPRQSLALVEAEGRRFLVATSPEGAPAFYALDKQARPARPATVLKERAERPLARVSW